MKTYRIERYLTSHELEQMSGAKRRRAITLSLLFTMACGAALTYFLVTR